MFQTVIMTFFSDSGVLAAFYYFMIKILPTVVINMVKCGMFKKMFRFSDVVKLL